MEAEQYYCQGLHVVSVSDLDTRLKVILNNIQNKLLKIACACVREKKPYHEGHRSVNPLKEQ